MTKANTTPAKGDSTTKQHRRLKVKQGYYDYQAKQWPKQRSVIGEILLKGKWLTDAGFTINDNVTVSIEQRKLVITAE